MAEIFGMGVKHIPASRVPRLTRVFEERLARLPLMRHPGFRYRLNQEGYREHCFGGRYAFACEFGALCHDLAHAVEFGPAAFEERCAPWGAFVFKVSQLEVGGRQYDHPTTGQATERECRTYGIQTRLAALFGLKVDIDAFATYCAYVNRHMPDWIAYNGNAPAMVRLIKDARDLHTDAQILERLEGWFDLTQQRCAKVAHC